MDTKQLAEFKKWIFPIVSRAPLRNIFPGEWESVFQGEGVEFAEIKPFEPGDRPRDMDLYSLAKSGEEQTLSRMETRQMQIYIWADFSGSMRGSEGMVFASKPEIRNAAIGLILFSAQKAYSPVGFYPFGLAGKKIFPPHMGEHQCFEVLDWLYSQEAHARSVSYGIENALAFLAERTYPRNIVFLISDFQQRFFDADFVEPLRKITKKVDLVPVIVLDPLERGVRRIPSVRVKVRSSGGVKELYLTTELVRRMQKAIASHLEHLERGFRKIGIRHIVLETPLLEECNKKFYDFFEARRI